VVIKDIGSIFCYQVERIYNVVLVWLYPDVLRENRVLVLEQGFSKDKEKERVECDGDVRF